MNKSDTNVLRTALARRVFLRAGSGFGALALAELLGVAEDCVNVKAKTGEKVGHIGRGEAIGCHAVVLLESK